VILAKEDSERGRALQREVAADALLRDRVRLLGHQPDLPETLRAFDVGVIASVASEANCRVGLEWMACGVPLLATRVGVLPDLVADGATGYLVPPGDPSALAEKVVYLGRRRDQVPGLGRAARDRVLGQFTLDHCACAHEQFLQELLQDRRP
jgi:glycosyltransferase involved in cell wall biosynthesis